MLFEEFEGGCNKMSDLKLHVNCYPNPGSGNCFCRCYLCNKPGIGYYECPLTYDDEPEMFALLCNVCHRLNKDDSRFRIVVLNKTAKNKVGLPCMAINPNNGIACNLDKGHKYYHNHTIS